MLEQGLGHSASAARGQRSGQLDAHALRLPCRRAAVPPPERGRARVHRHTSGQTAQAESGRARASDGAQRHSPASASVPGIGGLQPPYCAPAIGTDVPRVCVDRRLEPLPLNFVASGFFVG